MDRAQALEVLGLPPRATPTEARWAYRSLALDNHRDRNPNNALAEALMRRLNEAHAVLENRPAPQPGPCMASHTAAQQLRLHLQQTPRRHPQRVLCRALLNQVRLSFEMLPAILEFAGGGAAHR